MPLSADQIAVVRSWVGSEPSTTELQRYYARTASADAVVREVLRTRLVELTQEPASISVPGLSISNGQNIISLEALLKRFDQEGGTGLDTGSVSGVRTANMKRNFAR